MLLETYKQAGNIKEASRCLNKIAFIYWEHNHSEDAAKHYEASKELNARIGNLSGITKINNNLGLIYSDIRQYDKALERFQESLKERRRAGEKRPIISTLINVAVVLNNLKRNEEAIKYLDEALTNAVELRDSDRMKSVYGLLAETYQKSGNNEKMIEYYNLYKQFTEKRIRNSERSKKEAELQLRLAEQEKRIKELELEKTHVKLIEAGKISTDLADSLNKKEIAYAFLRKEKEELELKKRLQEVLNKEKMAEQDAALQRGKNRTIILISLISIILLILIFVFFISWRTHRNNKLLARKNQEISSAREEVVFQKENLEVAFEQIAQKNENITSSINYAERIQSAMLSSHGNLNEIFPKSFIFFKPRDIVSGDFYWFTEIDNQVVIACMDCTGHGVPGAFMSMIGMDLLNQIIQNEKITDPGSILNELDKRVFHALRQENSAAIQDGMDGSVMTFSKQSNTLFYAGAKHNLIYIEDGELKQVRGNKNPIGGSKGGKRAGSYISEKIALKPNTKCYAFTDGFQDQFGGKFNKKFMIKKLKTLLLNISKEPFEVQHQVLEETLASWKGTNQQTDDILLLGVGYEKQTAKQLPPEFL